VQKKKTGQTGPVFHNFISIYLMYLQKRIPPYLEDMVVMMLVDVDPLNHTGTKITIFSLSSF
jgi:hypothetical protein